jgi:hypothetical protein
MSMFNRNVKLQFNKMKYANLLSKQNIANNHNHSQNMNHVIKARVLYAIIGVSCAHSMLNFHIFKYKVTRGLARWKKRLVNLLPKGKNSHGHSHSHSQGHAQEKHDKNHGHEKEHH